VEGVEGGRGGRVPGREARGRLGTVAGVLLGIGILAAGWVLSREQELTIILVSLDTTRLDHLSAYGYDRETTPTLARLAAEGTVFTAARSSSSWTLPAHMSLFTGLPPDLHNVTIDFQQLDAGRRTMGEIFQAAGFRTVGLFTAPYVHGVYGFDRGMDFYEPMTRTPMLFDLPSGQRDAQAGMREIISHQEVTSGFVADRARFILEKRSQAKNLLFLHFFDPHYDYHPPPKVVQGFADPSYDGPVDGNAVLARPEVINAGMPERDRKQLLALYDAEIRYVDNQLANILQTVSATGRAESTIVVVTADHGEEFFDHGRIGHRMTLNDEVLRVPLIVWGPGRIPAGRVVEDDVAIYDVLPTLMDYADIPPDPLIYGRSLRPLIEGGSLPHRPVYSALTFIPAEGPDYYYRHSSLVLDGMKYVRRLKVPWSRSDPGRLDNPPELDSAVVQVFDLRADPNETHDLFPTRSTDPRVDAVIREFEAEERRQREALEVFQPRGIPDHESSVPSTYDETVRQLSALGYMESAIQGRPEGSASTSAGEPQASGPPVENPDR